MKFAAGVVELAEMLAHPMLFDIPEAEGGQHERFQMFVDAVRTGVVPPEDQLPPPGQRVMLRATVRTDCDYMVKYVREHDPEKLADFILKFVANDKRMAAFAGRGAKLATMEKHNMVYIGAEEWTDERVEETWRAAVEELAVQTFAREG